MGRKPPSREDGRVVVLRATSSAVVFWILVAVAVLYLGDAAIRGSWALLVWVAPIAGFVLWAAWAFLYRMSIRLSRDDLVAVNLLRRVRIPWARVTDVRRRLQLIVELDDGTAVECWGSPLPRKPGARRSDATVGGDVLGDDALSTVRTAWASGRGAPGTVVRTWDAPVVAMGLVLATLAVIALLVR